MGREYNHTAAFVAFSKGASVDEIALSLGIPVEYVRRWKTSEHWETMVDELRTVLAPAARPQSVVEVERGQQRILENRERNLVLATKLQEDLLEVITKLRAGTLKSERVFANGTRATVDPSLRDRCDLALYARNVADISYRALGDAEASKNPHADPAAPGVGQITIIMPQLSTAPREKQALEVEAELCVEERFTTTGTST